MTGATHCPYGSSQLAGPESRALLTPRLVAAFHRTEYEAAGAVSRIGHRSPAIDALLRGLGARQAVFVTAWNAWGRRRPRRWNERMQARLRQAVRRLAVAEGHGRGKGWSEAHLLIAVPPGRAAVIARRFRQLGIVVATVRGRARLIALAPSLRRL